MSSLIRCALLVMLLVALATVIAPADISAQVPEPTISAGMLVARDSSSPTLSSVWFWNESHVYVHVVGTNTTAEITTPGGLPVTGTRGMAACDNWSLGHPTNSDVWMWTDEALYTHLTGTLTTREMLRHNVDPIVCVKGIVFAVDLTSSSSYRAWVWSNNGVFAHGGGTFMQEITDPFFEPIAQVRGMMATTDDSPGNPTGSNVWFWNQEHIYGHVVTTTQAAELLDPDGSPITGCRGMVARSDNTSFTGYTAWAWNEAHVYGHIVATPNTAEITDGGGTPIAGCRGIIVSPDLSDPNPTGTNVWLWNEERVFAHVIGTSSCVEITAPGELSIPGVKGMVFSWDWSDFELNPTRANVWLWNQGHVYGHLIGTNTTVEITAPWLSPIDHTRGILVSNDQTSPSLTSVWFWADSGVFVHNFGTTSSFEITDEWGGHLTGTRAMIETEDLDVVHNPTRTNVWLWSEDWVRVHLIGGVTTAEITDPLGGAIADAWGVVESVDNTEFNPTHRNVWFRNGDQALIHAVGGLSTVEITDPDQESMGSPSYHSPVNAVALVWNCGYERQPAAGCDQSIAPHFVSMTGQDLGGSVYAPAPPDSLAPGLETVVGCGSESTAGPLTASYSTGTSLSNGSVAVLLTTGGMSGLPTASPPLTWSLDDAHPNPFNATVTVRYCAPVGGGKVSLRIYDVEGRLVRTLFDGRCETGLWTEVWDGRDDLHRAVAAGVYLLRMGAPGFTADRKLALVK
jgi:hypothetical protein